MLRQLSNVIIEGTWSAGLALLMTQGVVSPLALLITGTLFSVQAASGFPITNGVRALKNALIQFYDDHIDSDYQPTFGPMEKEEFDEEYSHEDDSDCGETHDNSFRSQLFEKQVSTFAPNTGFRRIPGMTWLFGEKPVTYGLAPLNPVEINHIQDGATRSGKVNFRTGDRYQEPTPPRPKAIMAPF